MNKKLNKKEKENKKQIKFPKMKTRKIIYLLAFAIAVLAIFFGCSCDREEPDVVAPSVPSGLNSTSTTNSINLSWSASTDNVGVVGYKIFRDGVSAGNATSTSFTDKNLVPNSSYVYTVSAFDANGNVSKLSTPYTAKTVDDCPTCSKWMTEINFIAPSVGIISAGEAKSAGSLIVKNISTSARTANFTLSFNENVANAIEELNYTIGSETVKRELSGSFVTLNQISVAANSSAEIKLNYKIKESIPLGIADQSQITLALTATTTDESGVTEPGNRIFPSVNLDKLYAPKLSAYISDIRAEYSNPFAIIGNAVSNELTITINNSANTDKVLKSLTANFGTNGKAVKMLRYLDGDGKWVVLKANNGEIVFNNLLLKPGENILKAYFSLKPETGVANNSALAFSFIKLDDGENGEVPTTGKFQAGLNVGSVNSATQATVVTSEWFGASSQSTLFLPPTATFFGLAYQIGNLVINGPADARFHSIRLKNPYASVETLVWDDSKWNIVFFPTYHEIFVDKINWDNDYVTLNFSVGNNIKVGNYNYIGIDADLKNISLTEDFNSGDFTPKVFGLVLTSKYDIVLQNSDRQMIDLSDVVVRHGPNIVEN